MSTTIRKADVSVLIPETWANEALAQLPKYLGLINTVSRDFEPLVANVGDKINVGKYGSFTANSKTAATEVTLQRPTTNEVEVSLSNHYEVTFAPEDVARAMAKPDIFRGYMTSAAIALAEKVEDTIAALYASAGQTVTGVTSSNIVTKLTEARRKLVTQKVPKNERKYGYFSEYVTEDLLNDDILKDASKLGSNVALVDGAIGRMRGIDTFESQCVKTSGSPTVYHNLIYVKDAIALVTRLLPTDAEYFGGAKQTVVYDEQTGLAMRVTMSYQHKDLAPMVTLDVLWGTAVLRSEHLIDFQATT